MVYYYCNSAHVHVHVCSALIIKGGMHILVCPVQFKATCACRYMYMYHCTL